MKKRLAAMLLAIVMAAGLLPGTARAAKNDEIAYPVTGGNIYFDAAAGAVTGCDDDVTEAVIPGEINGVPVTAIGDNAFCYCHNLTSVTLPDSVVSLGVNAFAFCGSLTGINLPDGLTTIGSQAFIYCYSLAGVTIPDSVTSIGYAAFYDCDSLTGVTIPDSVTAIGNGAFSSCGSLTGIDVASGNPAYISDDGVLFTADRTHLLAYPAGKRTPSAYNIPASVTDIGFAAFAGCTLSDVTIPIGVTTIGSEAFHGCVNLTGITIPSGVTTIGTWTFLGCGLTSIIIPGSVTTIEVNAFDGCERLRDIYYGGSESQWEQAISDNDAGLLEYYGTAIHYNSTAADPIAFPDVPDGEWFASPVRYCVQRGLIVGNDDGTFAPYDLLTRGAAVIILGRLDGADVENAAPWYQKAMNWAVARNISDGSDPEDDVSREQLAVMLWRYAGRPGADASVLNSFPDRYAIDGWAVDGMAWAVENGIVKGDGDKLDPLGTATRAEAVTMIMRFCGKLGI